jgi:MoaA/NifB/PqqE/SkfB family radical SAM enzyme
MDLRQFNTYKILSHIGTIKDLMSGKSPYPVSCEIDPSNLCNHGCSWCYFAGSRQADKKSLEEKLLFKLIEDLAGGGTKSVTFTGGGEPLINPAAPEAIRRAYSLGMRVGLVTNGGLLDKKKNKIIVSCCDFVRISLDAADEKSHNKLHNPHNPGKDNFKKSSYLGFFAQRIKEEHYDRGGFPYS